MVIDAINAMKILYVFVLFHISDDPDETFTSMEGIFLSEEEAYKALKAFRRDNRKYMNEKHYLRIDKVEVGQRLWKKSKYGGFIL